MSDEKLSKATQKEVEGLEPTLERLYGIIPLTTAIVTNHMRPLLARLERERDAALAALEEVEWIESEYDGRMYSSCPWCYVNDLCDGGLVHAKNCSRQAALTATPASTGEQS